MASTTAPIYPGSASFFIGDTPFGYYDEDPRFQCEVEEFSNWAAKRLGYPIMDVELQDKNFYAAYEDAVNDQENLELRVTLPGFKTPAALLFYGTHVYENSNLV